MAFTHSDNLDASLNKGHSGFTTPEAKGAYEAFHSQFQQLGKAPDGKTAGLTYDVHPDGTVTIRRPKDKEADSGDQGKPEAAKDAKMAGLTYDVHPDGTVTIRRPKEKDADNGGGDDKTKTATAAKDAQVAGMTYDVLPDGTVRIRRPPTQPGQPEAPQPVPRPTNLTLPPMEVPSAKV